MVAMAVGPQTVEGRNAQRRGEITVRTTATVALIQFDTNLMTNIFGMFEQFHRPWSSREDRPVDLRRDLKLYVRTDGL